MNAQELLQEIAEYCRRTGLAESTFGRRAVNDGKLASRLRNGGRITTETLDRIRAFMAANSGPGAPRRAPFSERLSVSVSAIATTPPRAPAAANQVADDPQRNFRFFDNRQKYLLF